MNKLIKQSISYAIILFLSFGTIELYLRIFDPIGIKYFGEVSRYTALMNPNDVYSYIHKPGLKNKFQGVDVAINSHGLRGPEFNKEKQPGKKRLLILGDSVVFGWGVPQKNIFSSELKNLFSRNRLEIEVISAGVGSWNTRTEYEYLRSTAINFKPDAIVLFIVHNDLQPKKTGYTEVSKAQLFLKDNGEKPRAGIIRKICRKSVCKTYLLQYILYFTKVQKSRQVQVEENSPMWEDARLALSGIERLCHKKNVEFIVYLYGSKSTVTQNSVLNLYYKYLKSIGVNTYLLPELLFDESNYWNSIVDSHPNIAGHKIIAQNIFEELLPRLKASEIVPSQITNK